MSKWLLGIFCGHLAENLTLVRKDRKWHIECKLCGLSVSEP